MVLSKDERMFIVEQYFLNNRSVKTLRVFKWNFRMRVLLMTVVISQLIAKFYIQCIVTNLPHVKPKTAMTPEVLATMAENLAGNETTPTSSSEEISSASHSWTTNIILRYRTSYFCSSRTASLQNLKCCAWTALPYHLL